jgi:hypothetical protein
MTEIDELARAYDRTVEAEGEAAESRVNAAKTGEDIIRATADLEQPDACAREAAEAQASAFREMKEAEEVAEAARRELLRALGWAPQ